MLQYLVPNASLTFCLQPLINWRLLNEPYLEWTYCSWKMPLVFPVQAFALSLYMECSAPRFLQVSLLLLWVLIQMSPQWGLLWLPPWLTLQCRNRNAFYPFLLCLPLEHLSSSSISFIIYLAYYLSPTRMCTPLGIVHSHLEELHGCCVLNSWRNGARLVTRQTSHVIEFTVQQRHTLPALTSCSSQIYLINR